jgi:hypothetical protein
VHSIRFNYSALEFATQVSNLRTGALLLIIISGFCHSGWGQSSQDPLPDPVPPRSESIPQTPDSTLAPPVLDQSGTPAEGEPKAPIFPAQEPTPITISPVESLEPAPNDPPKWRFHLGLDTSVTYDDNIFIQPTQRQADVYFGVTPIVAAGWGTFLADPTAITGMPSRFPQMADREALENAFFFRYAPTAVFFTRHTDQNAFNEDAQVAGRWISGKLALEAEGRYQTLSEPNIDVGNRINSETTSGFLNMSYKATEKTSLDSRFSLEHDSYQGGLNSTDTSLSSILNYQALPKTSVGIGFAVGYTTVENGQNQYYEQGLIHLHYTPTARISLDLTGGAEVREIENGPNRTTPVFDFEASYAARDSTTITLKVARRTDTSVLYEEQDIEMTTVDASIRQRIFQKVFLTLNGGVQRDDYVDAGAAADRTDTFSYFGAEFAVEVTKWLSMKAGYHFQNDDSSLAEFGFRRNLADFQFNLRF